MVALMVLMVAVYCDDVIFIIDIYLLSRFYLPMMVFIDFMLVTSLLHHFSSMVADAQNVYFKVLFLASLLLHSCLIMCIHLLLRRRN